jgi:cell wall-associated NlpC family hydrolase
VTASHVVAVPVTTVWTTPDSPRAIDRALVADAPDLPGWCVTHGGEDRVGLHGRVVTQALLGEPVQMLDEGDRWSRVVLPWQPSSLDARGYPGWVPTSHLLPAAGVEGVAGDGVAVVRPLTATLRTPGGGVEVSCGTVLPAVRRDDSEVMVGLPDGGVGWLDVADVVRRAGTFTAAVDVTAALSAARQFLGLAYLWGGTSGWGVDCSGLVHLAYRVHGVAVPRDAADQCAVLEAVGDDEVSVGDLLFFGRPDEPPHHVGLVTSPGPGDKLRMLHAPESGGLVEDAPLAPHRREMLAAARAASWPTPADGPVLGR